MATAFHESFDYGVGQLGNSYGVDTSVPGQITLQGPALAMEWATGPSAGQGYGTYTIHAEFTGSSPGPAIVFWPGDNQWPGQEIDMGEIAVDGSGRQYGIVHWNAGGSDAYQYTIYNGVTTGAWHDYTMVWEAGKLTFAIDGVVEGTLTSHIPADYDHGGMNNTIGFINSSNSTSLTVSDVRYTPLGAATPTATPATATPAPVVTPTYDPATLSAGSGTDALVLKVSQDAYQGSAQYTVAVDGTQVGGTFTASALHGSGQVDTVTINGTWGGAGHKVAVDFLNDAYGGSQGSDRNLYVESASYDGQNVPGVAHTFFASGSVALSVPATAATASATPATLSAGSGGDTLVLKVSQDAYQGSAQYTVAVDGTQVGGTFTASALHGSGQADTVTLSGNWGGTGHKVAVDFLNDAYAGTTGTDRNLYVEAVTYNGHDVAGAAHTLYAAGTTELSVAATAAAAPASTAPASTDWNALAAEAAANYAATGHWFI